MGLPIEFVIIVFVAVFIAFWAGGEKERNR
jgi:hypothetical protein